MDFNKTLDPLLVDAFAEEGFSKHKLCSMGQQLERMEEMLKKSFLKKDKNVKHQQDD